MELCLAGQLLRGGYFCSGVDILAHGWIYSCLELNPGVDIFDFTTGFRQVNLRLTPSHLLFVCNLTIFSLICDYEPFFQFFHFFRRVVLLNGHKAYMPYLE